MRIAVLAAYVATGLLASAGVAGAETTPGNSTPGVSTSPPPRVVGVQGVASEPIEQNASAQSADAVYRQAMTAAIADGLGKAQFLASGTGASVSQIQSVTEGGGYIQCTGEAEYEGVQPDFANGTGEFVSSTPAPLLAGRVAPSVSKTSTKHHKKRKRHLAKKATAGSCTLWTELSLVYSLS